MPSISFVTFLKDKYRHKSLHVCLTLVVTKDGPNISIFWWPKYFKTNISNFVPIISKQSLFSYSNMCTNIKLFQNNSKIFVLYFIYWYICIYVLCSFYKYCWPAQLFQNNIVKNIFKYWPKTPPLLLLKIVWEASPPFTL